MDGGVGGKQGLRQAGGFFAEKEPGVGGEACGPEGLAGQAGGEKDGFGADDLKERVEVVVDGDFDLPHVVHPGTFEVLVGENEPERAHEVQSGASGGTEAGDVAGIVGNFRLDEDDF